jgi:hypothetical protein
VKTVHLFPTSRVMEQWIDANHKQFKDAGWKHVSLTLYRHPNESEYHLLVATHRGAVDSLRGVTYDEVKVEGPWTDNLIELHDAAMMCVRPKGIKCEP